MLGKTERAHILDLMQMHKIDKTIFYRVLAEVAKLNLDTATEVDGERPFHCPPCAGNPCGLPFVHIDGLHKAPLLVGSTLHPKDMTATPYVDGFFVTDAEVKVAADRVYPADHRKVQIGPDIVQVILFPSFRVMSARLVLDLYHSGSC